jgi:glycogen(starch) synthase
MPRILILTPAEITRDPRARRAVAAAEAAGFEVVGLCPTTGGDPVPLEDVSVVRVAGDAISNRLRAAGLGRGRRDPALARELRGVFRLGRLAALTARLVRAGRLLGAFDVVHANDLDTLPAATIIARTHGARVVYDAHELYVEQELDPPRLHRALVRVLERVLARRAAAVITVNDQIAAELQRRLGLSALPAVVHNCPPLVETVTPTLRAGGPLRVVYQGALGHGRSLEDLLALADSLNGDVNLSFRVVGVPPGELRQLLRERGLEARAHVLDPVRPDELVEALATFDVGLVVTRPLTTNDELATPNKLFEYLMAGLAVAVPRLRGVQRIVEEHEVGVTFAPASPPDLARVLEELSADPDRLQRLRERARALAVSRYNAEAERPVLQAAWGVA